jgi:hypothetical protein
MRARSLHHTLRDRRRSRADQHKRQAQPPAPLLRSPEPAQAPDPAVQRVRSAGGPIDEASYVCQCGLQFLAPVSTTVACPHCHAPQAW